MFKRKALFYTGMETRRALPLKKHLFSFFWSRETPSASRLPGLAPSEPQSGSNMSLKALFLKASQANKGTEMETASGKIFFIFFTVVLYLSGQSQPLY